MGRAMKKPYLLLISLFSISCLCSCLPIAEICLDRYTNEEQKRQWEKHRIMNEEQKEQWEKQYEQVKEKNEERMREAAQHQRMGCVVVWNETASTVHLFLDFSGCRNVRPGRLARIRVAPGAHTLEAYDKKGQLRARIRITMGEYGQYDWRIGE